MGLLNDAVATFKEVLRLNASIVTDGTYVLGTSTNPIYIAESVPLTADATGRAKIAAGFFDLATALASFATDSIDATWLAKAVQDGAFAATSTIRALFADKFLPFAKANAFVSTEQTGTGSSQNVAHGLTGTPAAVLISVTELPDAAAETGFDVAEGAHDGTNVVVTVTSGVKFKVLAWV
jgi:hypothetical protein